MRRQGDGRIHVTVGILGARNLGIVRRYEIPQSALREPAVILFAGKWGIRPGGRPVCPAEIRAGGICAGDVGLYRLGTSQRRKKRELDAPLQIHDAGDIEHVFRLVGTVGGEVVVEIQPDVVDGLAVLVSVRSRELIPMSKSLVHFEQEGPIAGGSAWPPEING